MKISNKNSNKSVKMKTKIQLFGLLILTGLIFFKCDQNESTLNSQHRFNGPYKGEFLDRVAFPIGGIGAGMICMEGTGAISHVSVYNKPELFNEPQMFAAISVKGLDYGEKILEGPVPDFKIYKRPNNWNGDYGKTYGLPHFNYAEFDARIPFGKIKLQDDDIPLDVTITGWSPFIPLDPDNSSLPCGALEYTFVNSGDVEIDALFSFNTVNFMRRTHCINSINPFSNGFILSNQPPEHAPHMQGDFAIFTNDNATLIDHCWFRGSWFDPLSITWKHIANAEPRVTDPVEKNAPGASLYVPFTLKPGEEKKVRLMLTWYAPHTDLGFTSYEEPYDPIEEVEGSDSPYYQPWYSSRFKSIYEVAEYWLSNYNDLKRRSEKFTESFYNTTLPDEVVEAIAANLTILKSPTVLRQHDGRLWNFEGCTGSKGCCYGSCTHVWNYAQAIPHLFPSLERTLRETEFLVSQNKEGHQAFRSGLPIRPVSHDFHAAADGQLGGIMKAYREWRISGNDEWLKKMYPYIKKSLDYCIREWDPRETGSLEEPHHNTYDVEFWGPNGMCTSFYLGALKAMTLMGKYLGENVSYYHTLLDKGIKIMENDLFNGEYFYQKIQAKGLRAPSPIEETKESIGPYYSDEAKILLKKEGPKYQYGTGCLSDGILGMWIARVCGIDDEIVDTEKIKSHLESVYRYNFKTDLNDHANPQRPGYAMKHEGGLLICTWPKGGSLSLPFIYSNEVWTGIEYQVASHLMFLGKNKEALDIVRACRKRYDGRVRNPFSEWEAGYWYARALASYGMIQALTGVRYDAVTKTLFIDSKIGDDFDSFFSCQTGFGNIGLNNGKPYVKMVSGSLNVDKCFVGGEEVPVATIIFKTVDSLKTGRNQND